MHLPPRLLASCCVVMLLALAPRASACIAREPLRHVLSGAGPDIAACAERHALPPGHYAVRVAIDDGKAQHVEVTASPAPLGAPAQSCIEAAFTRLVFPSYDAPPRSPPIATSGGRAGRVPMPRERSTAITIMWPFTLGGG